MDRKDYDADYQRQYSKRVKRVNLTLSLDEYAELDALAFSLDIPPAQLAKRLTFAMLRGEKLVDDATRSELQHFSTLLRNISSNVNQIAKHSNRTKQVLDDANLFEHLKKLESLVIDFVKTGKAPL